MAVFQNKLLKAFKKSIRIPDNVYLFKVNHQITRSMCEICSKLTIKPPERRQFNGSVVFIVNSDYISRIVLCLIVDFE